MQETRDDDGGLRRLFNVFTPDGRMAIYAQEWSPGMRDKEQMVAVERSDTTEYAVSWKPDGSGKGTIEYFDGLTPMGRAQVTFDGPDRFTSRTLYHQLPERVGSTYDFRRAAGHDAGAADGRFAGSWVQDTADDWSTQRLFNEYAPDGTVTIRSEEWGYPSYKRDVPRVLKERGEATTARWGYDPESEVLTWTRDGQVMSRSKVTFDGPDAFAETVLFHDDVNQVGKTFRFRRADGRPPAGAEAANPLE